MLPFGDKKTEIYAEAAYPAYQFPTVEAAAAVPTVRESLASCLWSPTDMDQMSLTGVTDVTQLTKARLVHALDKIGVKIEGGTIMWEDAKEKTIQAQRVKMWTGIIGITDDQLTKVPTALLAYAQTGNTYYGFIVYEAYNTNTRAAHNIAVLQRQSYDNEDGPLTEIKLTQGEFDEHVTATLAGSTDDCVNLTYIVDAGFGDERESGVYSASGNVVRLLQVINSKYYYLDAAVNYKPDTKLHRTVEAYAKSGFVNVQSDGRSLIGVSYAKPYAVWEVPMVTTWDILADVVAKAKAAPPAAPLPPVPPPPVPPPPGSPPAAPPGPSAPPAGGGAAARGGSGLDTLIDKLRGEKKADTLKDYLTQGKMKSYADSDKFALAVDRMIAVLQSENTRAVMEVAAYLAGKGPGYPYNMSVGISTDIQTSIGNMEELANAAFAELTETNRTYTPKGMKVQYLIKPKGKSKQMLDAVVEEVTNDKDGNPTYTLTLKGGGTVENVYDKSIIPVLPVLPGTSVETEGSGDDEGTE
jgi:hypothetical protein